MKVQNLNYLTLADCLLQCAPFSVNSEEKLKRVLLSELSNYPMLNEHNTILCCNGR